MVVANLITDLVAPLAPIVRPLLPIFGAIRPVTFSCYTLSPYEYAVDSVQP